MLLSSLPPRAVKGSLERRDTGRNDDLDATLVRRGYTRVVWTGFSDLFDVPFRAAFDEFFLVHSIFKIFRPLKYVNCFAVVKLDH